MKLIMEGWRNYIVNEHMRDSLLEDYSYITEVLGVDLPVNESGDALPLTEELRDKILKEQLLLEGFWSGLLDKAKQKIMAPAVGIKEFGKKGWVILSSMYTAAKNPDLIGKFHGTLIKMMRRDPQGFKGVKSVLEDMIKRMPTLGMPNYSKIAQTSLDFVNSTFEKITSLSGWKSIVAASGFLLATKWLYATTKAFIEPYMQMATKSPEALVKWLKENFVASFKKFIIDSFPNITASLISVATGVKAWWAAITKIIGGSKFVIDGLYTAMNRFRKSNLGKVALSEHT